MGGMRNLLALFTLLCSHSFSQSVQATMTGTLTDAAGHGIPGAIVEAQQKDTGLTRGTESTVSGAYTIAGLPIGNYTISASKPGFSTAHANNIRLHVAQTRNLD